MTALWPDLDPVDGLRLELDDHGVATLWLDRPDKRWK